MTEQLSNSAASTLSAAITGVGDTTCSVANGTPFPASGNFRIIIDTELILVGARAGNNFSSMTRGIEGTTAATHSNAAVVTHVLTKAGLDQYLLENTVRQTVADAKGDLIAGTAADTFAKLTVGSNNQMIIADSTTASGLKWVTNELAYNQITSNVSITATTEATAQTVATASAVSFDGSTAVMVRFYAMQAAKGTTSMNIYLYDGASSIGNLAQVLVSGAPVMLERKLTPSNASHTYSIRAAVDAGTGTVVAGAGGSTNLMPAFIQITRV